MKTYHYYSVIWKFLHWKSVCWNILSVLGWAKVTQITDDLQVGYLESVLHFEPCIVALWSKCTLLKSTWIWQEQTETSLLERFWHSTCATVHTTLLQVFFSLSKGHIKIFLDFPYLSRTTSCWNHIPFRILIEYVTRVLLFPCSHEELHLQGWVVLQLYSACIWILRDFMPSPLRICYCIVRLSILCSVQL